MDRHPNDLTTDAEIDAALDAAKELEGEPRVASAEYLGGRADVIVLRLSTGGRLAIPREYLQGLEHATEAAARGDSALGWWDQRVVAAVGCGPLSAAPAGAPLWGCAVDGGVATSWGRGVERREEWRSGSGRPPQPAKSARRGPRSLRLRAMLPSQNRELGHPARAGVEFGGGFGGWIPLMHDAHE